MITAVLVAGVIGEFCLLVMLACAWPMGWEDKVTTAESRAKRTERENQQLTRQLGQVRNALQQVLADDARIVDQLMERGRAEIQELEAYYRRQLPRRGRS